MDLVMHELYKIWSRKSIRIAIAIFAFLTLFIMMGQRKVNYPLETYKRYSNIEGQVTMAKVNMASIDEEVVRQKLMIPSKVSNGDTIMVLSPEGQIRSSRNQAILQTNALLNDYNQNITRLNKELAELKGKKQTDTYKYRQKHLQLQMLKNIGPPQIRLYNSGWANTIDYINVSGIIVASVLILLGLAPVFSQEYAAGVDSLILTSRRGKSQIIAAKILASLIYTIIITLIFAALSFLAYMLLYSLTGGSNPIQSVYTYINSPYSWNITQYYSIQLLVHTTAALSFGILILLVSVLCRSPLVSLFTSGAIFGIPLFIENFIRPTKGILVRVVEFSYGRLIAVKDLFNQFKTYDLFGRPFLYPYMAMAFLMIITAMFVYLIYRNFRNHQVY